jgi:hypothetical protein
MKFLKDYWLYLVVFFLLCPQALCILGLVGAYAAAILLPPVLVWRLAVHFWPRRKAYQVETTPEIPPAPAPDPREQILSAHRVKEDLVRRLNLPPDEEKKAMETLTVQTLKELGEVR